MPDGTAAAPAPAAAPAAPAASSAPSGGSAPGKSSAPASPAPAPAAPKAPWGDSPLRVKVKMGDVEDVEEIADEEHLQRLAQQARYVGKVGKERKAAEERAKQLEAQRQADLESLKASPWEYLQKQGLNPDELVAARLAEAARLKLLDPEQLAFERARAEAERIRKEEVEPLKRKQAEYEARQKQAAYEQFADAAWERIHGSVLQAAQAQGLEFDESHWEMLAEHASDWLEAGVNMEPAQLLKQVMAVDEKKHWSRVAKVPGKALFARLTPEQKEAITAELVAEHRAKKNPAAAPKTRSNTPPEPPTSRSKPKEYQSPDEFSAKLSKRLG